MQSVFHGSLDSGRTCAYAYASTGSGGQNALRCEVTAIPSGGFALSAPIVGISACVTLDGHRSLSQTSTDRAMAEDIVTTGPRHVTRSV